MKSLTRWQSPELSTSAFGSLFGLRDELDRLFDKSFGVHLSRSWSPALDLYEDKDNVFVKLEVPGVKKEDIQISLQDGELSISGERKTEEKFEGAQVRRTERFVGSFQRTVTLPAEVKGDQVKAEYKDGILTVTLPKAEEAKPKRIQISAN